MGDLDGLPTSAVGQCGSDDSLGSFTVNPGNHRLAAGGLTTPARIPAGMSRTSEPRLPATRRQGDFAGQV